MNQTSVDYLENSIKDLIPNDIGSQLKFKNKVEQAKELHKQEIIDAYHKGCADQLRVYPDAEYNPEQYYSETYNK